MYSQNVDCLKCLTMMFSSFCNQYETDTRPNTLNRTMTTNTQKCLLLLFTLALAVTQTNAKYLDGILRLYRGDEGFVDSTAKSTDLTLHPVVAGTDHGITFQDDIPYGTESRPVFDFTFKGRARGSAVGLPGGDAHRTIMGWFKRTSGTYQNGYVCFSIFFVPFVSFLIVMILNLFLILL